ncbi:MAG: geranylgeranyl reductase family protein [Propionibacteriaceae bacterium]|nr:geranylgeranyl reductase family protein [Propionibacteriaceae bacterium]
MSEKIAADSADVIVVGAGPAGSATAGHLAKAGLNVVLLEKMEFPRKKVCGDGLTPRAVRELALLGIDVAELPWKRNRGLRIHVGRAQYLMEWPDLTSFPSFGMTVRRSVFDHYLAEHAVEAGANLLMGANVQTPIMRRGRIVGVTAKDGRSFRAPVVVAADGNSARLGISMGLHRLESRPLGVAIRTYFNSPASDEDWLDSWLELWDGAPGRSHLLPGYAWSFPMGDGTCNVGMGLPDANRYREVDYRQMMARWLAGMGKSWGFTPENQVSKIRSAALPMGFNRKPRYSRGLLLVGDAAGLINPFNGEGISYAMESGRFAAEHIIQAHARGFHSRSSDRVLSAYDSRLANEWGGYFWLGNLFGKIIAHPSVMRIAANYGLPIPAVRNLTHRMLAHLSDQPAQTAYDRVINALIHLAPKA